jgi:transposase
VDLRLALYAQPNPVERFFTAIRHFLGIATRYEKTARNFRPASASPAHSLGSNDDTP